MKLTDARFGLMIKSGRADVPKAPAVSAAGFAIEVNREQIQPIILALMQVQQMMNLADEESDI